MPGPLHPYLELIAPRVSAAAYGWLKSRHDQLDTASFAAAYAGAGRRLGSALVEPTADEVARLSAAELPVPRGWPVSAVARAALLSQVCRELEPETQLRLVTHQFKTGDNAERAALLKALPQLPMPERFVEVAVEACRSSVQSVFEAIACENPYPSRYFPDLNFNQLVLKAFFTEVTVRRIIGLEARRSAELVRMALGYASERRAAGRSVPADLSLVTDPPQPA